MKSTQKVGLLAIVLLTGACASTKNTSAGVQRDGSSFEQAVVVPAVKAEYSYVGQVCPNCQFINQSLTYENKKPYDILRFRTEKGDTVSYYFDISKFFGRGF